MCDGLSQLDGRDAASRRIEDFRGRAVSRVTDWGISISNYKIVARINRKTCIGCQLCYVACWDTAHQCIYVDEPAAVAGGTDGGAAKGATASAGHAPSFHPGSLPDSRHADHAP